MRVIGGAQKGHALGIPRGNRARPTADRVKESLFSIISGVLTDADVLDLYAGSGSLAIEALSRGARQAVLIDNHPQALICIRKNLEKTRLADRARIMGVSAHRGMGLLAAEKAAFDLVFMDPPYDRGLVEPTLRDLVQYRLLRCGALVVVEHTFKEEVPTDIANLPCIRKEVYGDTILTLLRFCIERQTDKGEEDD
ncbi:MAG: 16S rRNA (guanine(966)-N(2))-methyltransferase RsmD [Limnochordia bacterium]